MKLIILDRDGVINFDSDQFIKSPDEWKPIPGSLEAIARLSREGWRVVVAPNQSGLARGLFEEIATRYGRDLQDVPAVGDSLRDLLAAASVGARPLLVKTGKGRKTLAAGGLPEETPVFDDLMAAVEYLLSAAE